MPETPSRSEIRVIDAFSESSIRVPSLNRTTPRPFAPWPSRRAGDPPARSKVAIETAVGETVVPPGSDRTGTGGSGTGAESVGNGVAAVTDGAAKLDFGKSSIGRSDCRGAEGGGGAGGGPGGTGGGVSVTRTTGIAACGGEGLARRISPTAPTRSVAARREMTLDHELRGGAGIRRRRSARALGISPKAPRRPAPRRQSRSNSPWHRGHDWRWAAARSVRASSSSPE